MKPVTVDQYIAQFSNETQEILQKIRTLILEEAQDAVESISYAMPAYKVNKKPMIYFAAYENHIGIYALPTAHKAFQKELSIYKQGKGSVQFPLNKEIPYELIERMLTFQVQQLSL
ncbi:MAG: DUF1801 domain-containing protein [Bacteroidota bacterium]